MELTTSMSTIIQYPLNNVLFTDNDGYHLRLNSREPCIIQNNDSNNDRYLSLTRNIALLVTHHY